MGSHHSTRESIAGQIMKTLLIILVFSWSSQGRPQIGNTEEQQSIVSLQSGQHQFTNRLLQQIESNTTTNFVLSPHSIHSIFSQLLQGSGGQTKAELENLLGVTASDSLVEQYRPFLFVVYDFAHEVTLFAGKVVNPNNDNVIQTRAALIQEPASPAVAAPSANSEVCSKMFRDLPNSLDNSVICNKVASEGKKLDWLRKNRALCEESKDFFENFMSKSCGALWCDYAAPQLAEWSSEANSSGVG